MTAFCFRTVGHWSPAGGQIRVGDLPLGMALTPDDRYLLVTNNGHADQSVSVIDVDRREKGSRIAMEESWLELTFNAHGNRADAFGAELSSRMNFSELDAAPEELLNEIVWKSVKGEASEVPRPHTKRAWSGLPDGD